MRAIFLVLLLVEVLNINISIYNKAKRFIQIDACLDGGGRWNYDTNTCEKPDK